MQVIGLILGIFSFLGMFIFFIPLLGAFNWINIPFAVLGLTIILIGVATSRGGKGAGIVGIILCSVAIAVGIIRLSLGGGILYKTQKISVPQGWFLAFHARFYV